MKRLLYILVFLCPCSSIFAMKKADTQALENLAQALRQLAPGIGSASEEDERKRELVSFNEETYKKRLRSVVTRLKKGEAVSSDEVQFLLAEYLGRVAENTIKAIANTIKLLAPGVKDDPEAVRLMDKIPALMNDAVLLTFRFLQRVINKEFIQHLKDFQIRSRCFFMKEDQRKATAMCSDYCTDTKKCTQAIVADLRYIFDPLMEALVVGMKVGDKTIKGAVEEFAELLGPKYEKEMRPIVETLLILPEILELFEYGMGKKAPKPTTPAPAKKSLIEAEVKIEYKEKTPAETQAAVDDLLKSFDIDV